MRIAPLLIALAAAGCGLTGPSENLTGHWVAQSAGHTTLLGMTLQHSGDDITGTACMNSGGRIVYSGAAVGGDYPHLQFTEPSGQHFSGKQDSTLDIVGSYGTIDLRFKRSATPLCN